MTVGSLRTQTQQFALQITERYSEFKEQRLNHRRFKYEHILPLIAELGDRGFEVRSLGKSYQGRDINMLSIGTGPIDILMWSQMHGDEATATMALFDLFSYLSLDEPAVKEVLSKISLYVIPMLNPDGAQVFQRRTSQGIDMNRDALALQCPESKILKNIRDQISPQFGFNLHDQNSYYTAGHSPKPATISFLAPAYNEAKEVNHIRKNAMQVICCMNFALQGLIPGQVAKYDDAFETRAFGDNIQRWGTSTILVESGGNQHDTEKQQVRMLNFLALVTAIHSIASENYIDIPEQYYHEIPDNQENLNDLLIKNLRIEDDAGSYQVDVAVRREELDHGGVAPIFYQGVVEDTGDLSTRYGYEEISRAGIYYAPAGIYPKLQENIQDALALDVPSLLKQGYTALRLAELPPSFISFPLDLLGVESKPDWGFTPNNQASFLIKIEQQVVYAIINGFIHEIGAPKNTEAHGWIFR